MGAILSYRTRWSLMGLTISPPTKAYPQLLLFVVLHPKSDKVTSMTSENRFIVSTSCCALYRKHTKQKYTLIMKSNVKALLNVLEYLLFEF